MFRRWWQAWQRRRKRAWDRKHLFPIYAKLAPDINGFFDVCKMHRSASPHWRDFTYESQEAFYGPDALMILCDKLRMPAYQVAMYVVKDKRDRLF